MRLKKIIICIGVLILSPITIILVRNALLQLIGYDVDKDPKNLAQEIYEEGGSVTRCINLQWSLPTMGPTLDDQRSRCVLEYAYLAKDPNACKLLMPSKYGLSCVGYAIEKNDPCFISMNNEVRGAGIKTTIQECFNGPEQTKNNDCCVIARITKDSDYKSCAGLDDINLWNQCQQKLAFEKKDPSYC